ncbi:MAG: DUF58 domain-containing protein [Pirellulales bacterium]
MHWLVGAILVLVAAMLLGFSLLAYAMYALVGVIVISRLLADRWSLHLSARREISREKASIGQTVAVVVTLENKHWLPIPWLLVEDLLSRRALVHRPPSLEVVGRRLQLASFRGQGRKTIMYQLKCNRRGYFQIGPTIVETGDVFGLYRRYRLLSEPRYLLVYPEVIRLEGYDIASRRPIGEVRMTYRLFEDPTRMAGVRAYQAGDPLNRIHWRATARTGALQSKIYEPSTVSGATLLLDFHEKSFDPQHEPVRSELSVTMTASIAGALCEMGQQVGVVTNGRDAGEWDRHQEIEREQLATRKAAREAAVRDERHRLQPLVIPTSRGATQLPQILEMLARVELSDGLRFAQLVREATSRLPRSATVIAVLSLVTPEVAVALGTLRRRGYAVSAIINTHEEYQFAEMSAMLLAERVETRQLRDRDAIRTICARMVLR